MFKSKSVHTEVLSPESDDEHTLEIMYFDNILEFYLDGELIFSGDWLGNFRNVFFETIRYFPEPQREVK
jgi:hypothetical protein